MNEETKIKNSEILFLYDAKMCNPNGDPDEENKPRMDYETERNLVSDVRLKRYIRDYLISKEYEIWVSKVEGETVDATGRLGALADKYKKETKKEIDPKKPTNDFMRWLLDVLIDIRLFGATIPIKGGEEKGAAKTFTGPVQFSWGYSLHPVEIIPSSTITSTFAGRGEEYGTIGKDWRVYYSFLAFYGIVSSHRAEKTNLKPEDITLLDNTLLEAIPSEATTRSKLGQTPRLLLRVEYNKETFLGDFRRHISIQPNESKSLETLRDIGELKLKLSDLVNLLSDKANKDKIEKLYIWQHPDLRLMDDKPLKTLLEEAKFEKGKIQELPHSEGDREKQ